MRTTILAMMASATVAAPSFGQSVRAWEYNFEGQYTVPAKLGSCFAVGGGHGHSIALRTDGIVWVWGRNDYGQRNVPADLGPCPAVAGEACILP